MPMKDPLGDRMKEYENVETSRRLGPTKPIYARIDGRGFSKFTKGMERPFDQRMVRAMLSTTRFLIEETHARIGYTQSDEISLVWMVDDPQSDIFFAAKVQKMVSVLAALATAGFTQALLPELVDYIHKMPHFDARVFQLPTRSEAANAFLWREMDAQKNAVSMAARAQFSHNSLAGLNVHEMRDRLLTERGIIFDDYPSYFKRGTFLRSVTEERTLSEPERMAIPEKHRPAADQTFMRSQVKPLFDMPDFRTVANREAVIFDGAEPILKELVA